MRCGKSSTSQDRNVQPRMQSARNATKIGHFHKVCQFKKRGKRTNLVQAPTQDENDTHIDENGVRQPNPPVVNMLKIVNHIGATKGPQGKHLKFPIDVDPRGLYKHHLVVRVDTGADVNCMNEKTFKKLFPKVKLSVCPHEIQNFGNSVADISILGQFHTYLQFRPNTLGAQEMHQTRQELMKRQGNKPGKSYNELTPGTLVWVQHRQNATWKPAIVVNQCGR